MKLMIVESAGKIATLKKILGNDWKILATAGHIRELSDDNHGYGFNFTDFQPNFKYIEGKKKIMDEINKQAANAEEIFIAGDPDREGEAISYHIYSQLDKPAKAKSKRITFNELTDNEINKAISNPRKLDDNLIDSQFARVVLDKLFGYQASAAVRKSGAGASAGRVQSVALLLIDKRDEEIRNFKPESWYELIPTIGKADNQVLVLKTTLKAVNEEKQLKPITFHSLNEAKIFVRDNLTNDYVVESVSSPYEKIVQPPNPLITSAVLKYADKLKIKAKDVQKILQIFYENGICTYPRTDSITMRPEFCETIKTYIETNFGANYYNPLLPFNTKKQKDSVQEGHDAIRPVNINVGPENLDAFDKYSLAIGSLKDKAKELYNIIRTKTIASCMQPKVMQNVDLVFDNNNFKFYSCVSAVKFDGFSKIDNETKKNEEEQMLDLSNLQIQKNDLFHCLDMEEMYKDKRTKPPVLYTQATLIATLEKKEIGRPSTYVSMVQINIDRGYVDLVDNKMLINEKGKAVVKFIKSFFSDVINEEYTKEMEKDLDKIAKGKMQWIEEFIKPFWSNLKIVLNKFEKEIESNNNNQITYKKPVLKVCPACQSSTRVKIVGKNRDKAIEECSTNQWDFKKKKTIGCGWMQWLS